MAKRRKRSLADGISFDFSSLSFGGTQKDEEREQAIPKLSYLPVDFMHAEDMARRIQWGKHDYIALLAGTFIFGDFLEALLHEQALAPSKMYITTLGMNQENIDSIVNMVQYLYCEELNLIVSHYFAGVERHNLMEYMEDEFKGLNINIAVLQSHAKMCVIRSRTRADGAIIGSANLSSSNNVEQMLLLHDPTAIDYLETQLQNIMDRFTVYEGKGAAKIDWTANRDNVGLKAFKALKNETK